MFGLDVEIGIVSHFKGRFAGKAWLKNGNKLHQIKIAKWTLKNELPRDVIWHEVGHLYTWKKENTYLENETNAQMWVMLEVKKRGYTKLYKEFLKYVRDMSKGFDTDSDEVFRKAGRIILKRLGEKL